MFSCGGRQIEEGCRCTRMSKINLYGANVFANVNQREQGTVTGVQIKVDLIFYFRISMKWDNKMVVCKFLDFHEQSETFFKRNVSLL